LLKGKDDHRDAFTKRIDAAGGWLHQPATQ
jgi:hypothetical protein